MKDDFDYKKAWELAAERGIFNSNCYRVELRDIDPRGVKLFEEVKDLVLEHRDHFNHLYRFTVDADSVPTLYNFIKDKYTEDELNRFK